MPKVEVKPKTAVMPKTVVKPKTAVKPKTVVKPKTEDDPIHEAKLWKNYRLPTSLVPLYYNVTLWPQLKMDIYGRYIFIGHSGAAFMCVNETDLILIHSYELKYSLTWGRHHAMLRGLSGAKAPAIKKIWLEVETQYLVVQLSEKLQVGMTYWLYTEFQGELADDLRGFYRSEFFENGVKKVVATTQMQPTFARKAFPCFDEPAMKAVFHMTLIHPLRTVALANGMETATEIIFHNKKLVLQTKFEPTEKMSTYLLAFVVSDFISIKSPAEAKVLIRIWAQRKAIEAGQGKYALNITGNIINFYQNYYNSTYPLQKSDQIALPTFSFGAMENSFKEKALLFDPSMSSNQDHEWALMANSHEVAHMWFGNLVTMKWWNDLWLNEGLATYVSYLGADDVQPTWNMKDLMVLYEVQKAFALDAVASSHPLSSPEEKVNTPAEIADQFDYITYSKGAAVLRMLSEFLSEPVFARGLSAYLKQFAYGNTVYTDLWGNLQEVVDSDPAVNLPASVTEIMNRWILQMGYPVVTIDTQTGRISQEHFLLDSESEPDRPSLYNYEWFVPIKWMKNGTVMGQHWLLEKTATHEPMRTNSEWVLANVNVSGFYRVNYDSQNWQRLISQLTSDHSVIPVINRAQILDDAFKLARAKIISITVALSITKYLSEEREYMPWESAIKKLDHFFLMFDWTEVYGAMEEYLRGKVQPLFNYFKNITADWTEIPSSHTDQYNQVNAISLACITGVEGCVNLTKTWYRQWMENPDKNPIHPNLKMTVYCNAIAAGGVEEWEFGWNMYKSSSSAAEAEMLLYGLSCSKDLSLLSRYLKYTLGVNMIRKQDATSAILYVANNKHGHLLTWFFIRDNWDHIIYEGGLFSFSRIILGVSKRFSTLFELIWLRQFREELLYSGFINTAFVVHHAIETTKANMKWVAQNKKEVMRWLTEESA
ncbi:aminopeptidase N-like [Pygocentrus nattereri]|uniref:aminopeptidase N-like n=1 Tax=Pygocentrus nattereri TaxID=42514 RepID=UPI0018917BAE|nr:aminopeptidase N-like [Pygocentrus nattereri]